MSSRSSRYLRRSPIAIAALLVVSGAYAQVAETPAVMPEQTLGAITVNASADASAEGLSAPYAGGQVARGGKIGILGTQDNMDVPFNITSYTNQLIQDQQARTIGDVLKNDPSVRVARGFGNFQESYFIRGFILASDEIAYNGLYSILPRQSIATELIERVEVLRGASTFLTGAAPGGGGIGGTINLLPKRAPNQPLTQVSVSGGTGGQKRVSADIARRFGPDGSTGIRVNAVHGEGGTGVDREESKIDVLSVGADWRSRDVRLSADVGYQNNKLKKSRTSVALGTGVTSVPDVPDNQSNWAQDWTHSYERDLFGTFRGEYDINSTWTAWAAFGARRTKESNVLDNITVNNNAGDASAFRFDNNRDDTVRSGEIGLRGKLRTGSVSHTVVGSASSYSLSSKNAFAFGGFYSTNLYNPTFVPEPVISTPTGGDLNNPLVTSSNKFTSYAVGDTMGFAQDKVLVTVGARYQELDLKSYNFQTGALNEGGSYNASRTSPVLGVVWKIQNNLSAYVNYIESLSQGGVAPVDGTVTNPGQVFSPFVAKQKEIGLKYDGGRFGGSVALFSTNKPGTFKT
ncbi:MAG TPA: TonB-dependent receptor, partial [Oxalicibacterium sp.]|nr:TonB-dependent receptor [Oxalicibacterium sp.]